MKVTCKSCGKKFDPEKTGHMCPRCGSWYVEKNIDGQFESGAASADAVITIRIRHHILKTRINSMETCTASGSRRKKKTYSIMKREWKKSA